jgi:AcrR family transcriptional regulator
MENTVKPINKKTEIFLVANQFFYEYGYKATTFNMIADACSVTNPLITFHYKTKANLANQIVISHNQKRKNIVARKLYDNYKKYDLQIATAMEQELFFMQMHQDSNVYRFFHERINDDFDIYATAVSMPLYKAHERKYHLDINQDIDELKMAALSSKGALASLIISYYSGGIDCSYEEFSDYGTSLPFRFMNLPHEKILEIIENSKKIIQELDFKFAPYFEIY